MIVCRSMCLLIGTFYLLIGGTRATTANAHLSSACLTASTAQTLADNFGWLVSSWSLNATYSAALLNATYAVDFTDWSDSIRVLESYGCTNGPQPLDRNRAEFAADQLTLPPFEFRVVRVWHSCDDVTFLWEHPGAVQRVRGLVVLETGVSEGDGKRGPAKRVVKAAYSEFNTVSWFVNVGEFKPSANCTGAAPPLLS